MGFGLTLNHSMVIDSLRCLKIKKGKLPNVNEFNVMWLCSEKNIGAACFSILHRRETIIRVAVYILLSM